MSASSIVPEIVSSLYSAAARNDWPPALTKIGQALNGDFTLIGLVDKARGTTASLTSRPFYPGNKELYRERFFRINPRSTHAARARPGEVFSDADLADRRSLARHPYYAEFLAPMTLAYFIAGNLKNDPQRRVNLSVQRSIRTGHAESGDVALLSHILPHAAAAFDLWERLQSANAQAHMSRAALEAMPVAAIVVNGSKEIVFANAASTDALSALGPFSVEGYLSAREHASARNLQIALDAALADNAHSRPSAIFLRGADGRKWSVSIQPLPDLERVDGTLLTSAAVFAELQKPLAKAEDLQRLLGLTAAEAALAAALADGFTLRQYAERAGVSINTIRTHLASLRDKLVAKNQAQIVARVLKTLA